MPNHAGLNLSASLNDETNLVGAGLGRRFKERKKLKAIKFEANVQSKDI